jgi:hypothetical protein
MYVFYFLLVECGRSAWFRCLLCSVDRLSKDAEEAKSDATKKMNEAADTVSKKMNEAGDKAKSAMGWNEPTTSSGHGHEI